METQLIKEFTTRADLLLYLKGVAHHFADNGWTAEISDRQGGNQIWLKLVMAPVILWVVYEYRRGQRNQWNWYLNHKKPHKGYREMSELHIDTVKIGDG